MEGGAEIIIALGGAAIGICASIIGAIAAYILMKGDQKLFSASVLYNDLKSIEKYLRDTSSSANLRYSEIWQQMVANCLFLKEEDVETVYSIYDEVYDYNYRYKQKESGGSVRKEDINSYKNLKNKMFDTSKGYPDYEKYSERYEHLMISLRRHMKSKFKFT